MCVFVKGLQQPNIHIFCHVTGVTGTQDGSSITVCLSVLGLNVYMLNAATEFPSKLHVRSQMMLEGPASLSKDIFNKVRPNLSSEDKKQTHQR